jgi:hypothetical protein
MAEPVVFVRRQRTFKADNWREADRFLRLRDRADGILLRWLNRELRRTGRSLWGDPEILASEAVGDAFIRNQTWYRLRWHESVGD